jgi:inner membrane protein
LDFAGDNAGRDLSPAPAPEFHPEFTFPSRVFHPGGLSFSCRENGLRRKKENTMNTDKNPGADPLNLPEGAWQGLQKAKTGFGSLGKMIVIGILMGLLLIPVSMIQGVISERETYGSQAQSEVQQKWGGNQRLDGPVLTVPYLTYTKDGKGKVIETSVAYAHFLPEVLDVQGEMTPEIRHRGIFEVPLFKADLHLQGHFSQPDFSEWKVAPSDIQWNDAYVTIAVPDVRSLADALPLEWGADKVGLAPEGLKGAPFSSGGLQAHVRMAAAPPSRQGYAFACHLTVNGSGAMRFLPMGRETRVSLQSKWPTPSFNGAFLPSESAVDDKGFSARWKTLYLSRSLPQSWRGWEVTSKDWESYAFGVDFLLPVERYQMTMRCAKYASLFILLTFVVFFLFEVFDKRRIHPMQYLLVGFALSLFYLLLFALSEHMPFRLAYLVAACGIVGLITGYGAAVLSAKKRAWSLAGMLTALYAYLYSLLQMEDYSLLMGALGLFLILGAVMFLTRKINWYAVRTAPAEPAL